MKYLFLLLCFGLFGCEYYDLPMGPPQKVPEFNRVPIEEGVVSDYNCMDHSCRVIIQFAEEEVRGHYTIATTSSLVVKDDWMCHVRFECHKPYISCNLPVLTNPRPSDWAYSTTSFWVLCEESYSLY